jgi:hypothetical protein
MMGRLNGSRGCCPIRSGFDEVVPDDHRVREIAWRPGSIVGRKTKKARNALRALISDLSN